ncbi:hypothetical protein L3Q82_017213 [Scortum barcoo]|uniref:Uncharacterized protein n=1 Tax=Scortum barcoo TaxID=214431 RepID=A0ACB8VLL0_9TELE|nr:hypothetical protein L3Q82_017213 [Scortum barcoo]
MIEMKRAGVFEPDVSPDGKPECARRYVLSTRPDRQRKVLGVADRWAWKTARTSGHFTSGVSTIDQLHAHRCGRLSALCGCGGAHAAGTHQADDGREAAAGERGCPFLLRAAGTLCGVVPIKRRGSPGLRRELNGLVTMDHADQQSGQALVRHAIDQQVSHCSKSIGKQPVARCPYRPPPPTPSHSQVSKASAEVFCSSAALQFKLKPVSFSSDLTKINFILWLLRGRALTWAEATYACRVLEGVSFHKFLEEFKLVFDHPNVCFNASIRLMKLPRGQRSVADSNRGTPWR